jgi:hypothetical protein
MWKKTDLFNKHILCGCGWTYYKRHYKRHLNTEHHKEWEDPEYKSPYTKIECGIHINNLEEKEKMI